METRSRVTIRDGFTIAYRLSREGAQPRQLIVLLHGMASNLTRWSEFIEHTDLLNSWDILRVDLRGHGESMYRGKLTMEIWARDLLDILDQEGYRQALVIGHSLGAQIAVWFASLYADRVRGLVLIDPVFDQALRGTMRLACSLRPLIWLAVQVVRLFNRLGLYRRHIPNRDLRLLDEETRRALLSAGKQKEMIRMYTSPWLDLKYFPTANYLQELAELVRPLPPLRDIHAPVLVILSAGITFTDPRLVHETLAQLRNGSTMTVEAYHWPLTEKPLEVRHAIEKWCKNA